MKTALLFPGQGSQVPGMGRAIAERSSDFMELWKWAEKCAGLPLREIYWDADEAALQADTRNLQPALTAVTLTTCAFALPLLEQKGFEVFGLAGHSLGEYAALASAGAIRADECLRLVARRGALMADADSEGRGGMAAVLKLALNDLEEAIEAAKKDMNGSDEVLVIANHNTPAQYVVSGTKDALDVLAPHIRERRGRMIPLSVSGAFHSPLMTNASKQLAEHITRIVWTKPKWPVYSNIDGSASSDKEKLRQALLAQMTGSVHWIATVRNMWNDGVRAFIEIGPKGVLSRMIRPILEQHVTDAGELDTLFVQNVDTPDMIAAL